MNLKSWLLAAAAAVAFANPASAAYVLNTGTPTVDNQWGLSNYQYFGVQFTLANDSVVNGVEGYFGAQYGGGMMDFAVHAGGGNTPGAILFSSTVAYSSGTAMDWHGVSGLDWDLSAGTYWLSFHTDQAFSGLMPGSVTAPASKYVQGYGDYNWYDTGNGGLPYLKVGARIDAVDAVALPEPASLALVGLSLAVLVATRRKQRAK